MNRIKYCPMCGVEVHEQNVDGFGRLELTARWYVTA